jgi:DNA primase
MIPQEYIQSLLERADIVALINVDVPLVKQGRNFFGRCPFHGLRPTRHAELSFSVSPEKNFYHCFGCGAHGSLIQFYIQHKDLSFVEAVELLAAKVGMPPPDTSTARKKRRSADMAMADVYRKAVTRYRQALKETPAAIAFLKACGISGKTAATYQLGYAPDDWKTLAPVFGDAYDATCIEAGLAIKSRNGHVYDRFRGRLMFPLFDAKKQALGLIGRRLEGNSNQPLYLRNSKHVASTPSAGIFGLVQADQAIRERGYALVVQDCMDVLALYEQGFSNAVSTPGTTGWALSSEHLRHLFSKTNELVFCFSSGESAAHDTWKTVQNVLPVLEDHRLVRVVQLPSEHTPSSLLKLDGGSGEFAFLLQGAVPLSEFFVQALVKRHDIRTIEGRAALLDEAATLLDELNAPHWKRLLQERIDVLCRGDLEVLTSVEEHDAWLVNTISATQRSLVIVSPWITSQGVERAGLCSRIADAVARGVVVTIYTDAELNRARRLRPRGDLFADGAYEALMDAGAQIVFVHRVHSKFVLGDDDVLAIGSFNWLSAAKAGRYRRQDISTIQRHGAVAQRSQVLIEMLDVSRCTYDRDGDAVERPE